MGYSMRTDRYRLVSWRDHRNKLSTPLYTELYDHNTDPTETVNIAGEKEALVRKLNKRLNGLLE